MVRQETIVLNAVFGDVDLTLKCIEFCMEEFEEVGETETFSDQDYIKMITLRGRIIGLSPEEIAQDLTNIPALMEEEEEEGE